MPRTAVITGTATGIGRETVKKFSAEGWNVVATVRKESDLQVHDGLPHTRTLLHDVDDEAGAVTFAARAGEQFGSVDLLVNNAGYYQMGPLEATSMEQVHRQFHTNVFALIALSKAFLPTFRERRSGMIINLASMSADQGYPYTSVYAASKAAVAVLSEGMSLELAEFGIVVKTVLPGQTATRIFTKIDLADSLPDYEHGIKTFFTNNSVTGAEPSVAAAVIYRAASDGQDTVVRYFSGPDSVAVQRAKNVLGASAYWDEFQGGVYGNRSALLQALIPTGGEAPVEFSI